MREKLTPEQTGTIDAILTAAADEGRRQLYEPEVYRILEVLGVQVPTYVFLRTPEELDGSVLAQFGSEELILKVVSGEIAHKSRVGGVRKVARDRERIRAAMRRMAAEVPAHPLHKGSAPKIDGFMLTTLVEYSRELGNEILIGAKENLAFGPVVSFSKGGNDAEHFARYFSSPNVRLLPLEREDCDDLLETTEIVRKYRAEGNAEYATLAADVIYRFSQLFEHFSCLNPEPPRHLLSEFEVNPLVFDEDHSLVAIDGLASIYPADQAHPVEGGVNAEGLEGVFWPDGIAVIGVSAKDSGKTGNNIATLLHRLGREDLYLVNAKGGAATIDGQEYPLYKNLQEIDGRVDLVVVTVPAAFAPAVAKEAREKGSRGLILIPGGFSEVEGGESLEKQITEIVAGTGIRMIGPNCLGIFRAPSDRQAGINTLFIPESKLEFRPKKESNVALLTQSGALGITELDKLKNAIYPRVVVSYGNQIDVDPADLAAYFDADPEIDVLAFYIEGFKEAGGRRFFDAVRGLSKPAIVYKAGRTDAGSRAAASHTASMTGDYKVALAAMEQAGAIVADHILDHKDLIKVFALMGRKPFRGRRVAGVVNAGFESTYAADSIGQLELASFSDRTTEALRSSLPSFVSINPFMDLTPMADDAVFEHCIEVLLSDAGVDCLFISIVPHTVMLHTNREELERDEENIAHRIIRQGRAADKPIVVSVNAGTMYNAFVETLEEGGIPTFSTAERAMLALNRLADYRLGG